jgi:hypothetical protein
MNDKLATVETIFFDESGTPAVLNEDGLFVVGGFSIRGDTDPTLEAWEIFLNGLHLHGKKGRKYSAAEFLDLSDFMCKNRVIPLASHSYLNEDDVHTLWQKISKYHEIGDRIKSNKLDIKANKYLWTLQVAITIASSILSLMINRGEISKILVSVDQYLSDEKLRTIINQVVTNFFEPSKFKSFLKNSLGRLKSHPDTIKLFSNFKPEYEFIELDWNSRGKFKLLADAICAMYRKTLQGDSGAKVAWDVLKLCYKKNGKIPFCIGNNITTYVREIVRRPWLIPNV